MPEVPTALAAWAQQSWGRLFQTPPDPAHKVKSDSGDLLASLGSRSWGDREFHVHFSFFPDAGSLREEQETLVPAAGAELGRVSPGCPAMVQPGLLSYSSPVGISSATR